MSGNILIATAQVPFARGGAEILVDGLQRQLVKRGYQVDVIQLPFRAHKEYLLEGIKLWRSLDLREFNGKAVDLVIATKFPSYFAHHPKKALWLVHQHRQMYDLYGSRFADFQDTVESEALRRVLMREELGELSKFEVLSAISGNVSDRLERFLGLSAKVLTPPPPLGDRYYQGPRGDYILSVGRICTIKRVDLIVKSLPLMSPDIKLKIVGVPDEPGIQEYLNNEIELHQLQHRVEFCGRVSEEELLRLYAECFAVYYAPVDEDYGFVTLEGLASGKPIITATDSGGTLAYVHHRENGFVAEPTPHGIAAACNELNSDPDLYERMICAERPQTHDWDAVIETLTSPIRNSRAESVRG